MAKTTLPQLLKNGIENGDWSIICSLYKSITGLTIEPPKIVKVKNTFVDDGSLVKKEKPEEKKLYNPPNLTNRRDPIRYIKVKCGCGKVDELPEGIAKVYLARGEDAPQYKCQRCISRNKHE
jgi:hypothetical protein